MNAQALSRIGMVCLLCALQHNVYGIITTLSKNDPVPVYTADSPFALLGTRHYEYLKGREEIDDHKHMSIEILPFFQWASKGRDSCGTTVELGDISGKWNMIAVLPYNEPYAGEGSSITNTNDDLPCGSTFPAVLINARDNLITDIDQLVSPNSQTVPWQLRSVQGLLSLQQTSTTLSQAFGFFSVPMKYQKSGVRFNVQFYVGAGFGATVQTGVANIWQCASFIDKTPTTTGGNPFTSIQITKGSGESAGKTAHVYTATWVQITKAVSSDLMSQLENIVTSTEIGQSICTYNKYSMEDLYAEFFWRYPVQINKNLTTMEYPKFLFIPFMAFGGTFAVGKPKDPNALLGLPFGNNEHDALRIRGGFSLDFYETVQANFEAGATFFRGRNYCDIPFPTNEYQYPIYPFRTDVRVQPGRNVHLVFGIYAHDFLEHWSCSCDYIIMNHTKDTICLRKANNAAGVPGHETVCRGNIHPFKPGVLECMSEWSTQVLNATLTYALSPDFSWGVAMQFPITCKNAYKSTTFAASLYIAV